MLDYHWPGKFLIEITEALRDDTRQAKLVKEGLSQVKPGFSFHGYGLAIDLAIYNISENKYDWAPYPSKIDGIIREPLKILGATWVLQYGGTWGGNWKTLKDKPHFQLDYGLKIEEIKRWHEISTTWLATKLTDAAIEYFGIYN